MIPRLTLALVLLLFPATAQAASGTMAGMTVGARVWGMPACGQPHVEVTTPTAYQAAHGTSEFGGNQPLAWADETRCVIAINRELAHIEIRTPAKRCHVIVHEWGHLAGRGHSDNPRSVMFGEDIIAEGWVLRGKRKVMQAANAFKPCYAATGQQRV